MVNSKISPIVVLLTIFITLTIIIILSTPKYYKYQYFIFAEQKILTDSTTDSNNNPSIKVIIPTDQVSNMATVNLGSQFHVEWKNIDITGDPQLSIQAYSVLPTLPNPTYLPVGKDPYSGKLSENSFELLIDPAQFQANNWYIIRIWDKNNENINGTSDPFLVTS